MRITPIVWMSTELLLTWTAKRRIGPPAMRKMEVPMPIWAPGTPNGPSSAVRTRRAPQQRGEGVEGARRAGRQPGERRGRLLDVGQGESRCLEAEPPEPA